MVPGFASISSERQLDKLEELENLIRIEDKQETRLDREDKELARVKMVT